MREKSWFPSHMLRTTGAVRQLLKLANVIIEVRDARAPAATAPGAIEGMGRGKPRLVVLNKSDLATEKGTGEWLSRFAREGVEAIAVDSTELSSRKKVLAVLNKFRARILAEKKALARILLKVIVAGIPNVGKSRLINLLAGKNASPVADKPGFTKGPRWVSVGEGLELLDTPGLLEPEKPGRNRYRMLAMLGAIPENVVSLEELACEILDFYLSGEGYMKEWQESSLLRAAREAALRNDESILASVARFNGFLTSNGEPDVERLAALVVRKFREGHLGRITFESPWNVSETETHVDTGTDNDETVNCGKVNDINV